MTSWGPLLWLPRSWARGMGYQARQALGILATLSALAWVDAGNMCSNFTINIVLFAVECTSGRLFLKVVMQSRRSIDDSTVRA